MKKNGVFFNVFSELKKNVFFCYIFSTVKTLDLFSVF
jgi:hypothetical protein